MNKSILKRVNKAIKSNKKTCEQYNDWLNINRLMLSKRIWSKVITFRCRSVLR